jgi:phosphate transport system substrate-binding protein
VNLSPLLAAVTLLVQGTLNQGALLKTAAADFQATHPGINVESKATNAGQGIAALRAKSIDIASADIGLSDPDLDDTTLGVLGFAIITGPHTGVKNLSRAQLQGIYSGSITNWKQVGGEDQPIVLFDRGIGTGIRLIFEQKVAKSTTGKSSAPIDPNELVKDVATTPGAIGYIASPFIVKQPELAISYNGVAMTPEAVRSHAYGFSSDEHLYTRKDASAEARAFVEYVKGNTALLNTNGIY